MSPRRTLYAAEARADWQNLLEMARQPGRRPSVRVVRRLGRAAGITPAAVAAAIVVTGAVR